MTHHLRGPTSRLARVRCTLLATTRRWSTFTLAEPVEPAALAATLDAPVAWLDADPRRTTAVFVTSDGWRAEVVVDVDEPPSVDHELLEALVRRRILTVIQRVRLAAKLRARPDVRAAWLASNGLAQLIGLPGGRV